MYQYSQFTGPGQCLGKERDLERGFCTLGCLLNDSRNHAVLIYIVYNGCFKFVGVVYGTEKDSPSTIRHVVVQLMGCTRSGRFLKRLQVRELKSTPNRGRDTT